LISVCPLVFGVLLGLVATPTLAADTKPGAVQPIGVYSGVKATEDHTYGHKVRLWRLRHRLVGQVTYWDADPEGQHGIFEDGDFNPQTGEFRFSVTVTRHNVQPNVHTRASFHGRLAKNVVAGDLKWEGQDAETRGKAGVEKLTLQVEKGERLKPFSDIDTWRKAAPH
jgi:hypothetical protein